MPQTDTREWVTILPEMNMENDREVTFRFEGHPPLREIFQIRLEAAFVGHSQIVHRSAYSDRLVLVLAENSDPEDTKFGAFVNEAIATVYADIYRRSPRF